MVFRSHRHFFVDFCTVVQFMFKVRYATNSRYNFQKTLDISVAKIKKKSFLEDQLVSKKLKDKCQYNEDNGTNGFNVTWEGVFDTRVLLYRHDIGLLGRAGVYELNFSDITRDQVEKLLLLYYVIWWDVMPDEYSCAFINSNYKYYAECFDAHILSNEGRVDSRT